MLKNMARTAMWGSDAGTDGQRLGADRVRTVRRLALVSSVVGTLFGVALGIAGWLSYDSAVRRSDRATQSIVSMLSREAGHVFSSADLVLGQLEKLSLETDWSDSLSRQAAELDLSRLKSVSPPPFRFFIWNETGHLLLTSVPGDFSGFRADDREYFTAHRNWDSGLFISDLVIGKIENRPLFVLSRRVNGPAGRFSGVVSIGIEPERLGKLYESVNTADGSTVFWGKYNRRILLREPSLPPQQMVEAQVSDALATAVENAPQGRIDGLVSSIDGVQRSTFYQRVPGYPLFMSLSVPSGVVLRDWVREALPYIVLALVSLAALVAAFIMAVRWAAKEDGYRQTLADLNCRLTASNKELSEGVQDRTERLQEIVRQKDQLLAQKDMLFREMNHRVKNSLQIVASLLQMQGVSASDPLLQSAFGEAVARVMAVARVHEQLYRTDDNIGVVDLLDYLKALCRDLERSALTSGGLWQVCVSGGPVLLSPDRAIPLGLIVNELVTNAFKHAMPLDGPGDGPGEKWSVQVGLASTDGQIRLTVRDFGPGFGTGSEVSVREGGSLGIRLVKSLVGQIDGVLSVEKASPGARFVVAVPA